MDMFYMSPEVPPDDYVPWEEPEDTTMPRPQERAGERGTSLTMKFNSSSLLQIQADRRRDCHRTWFTNSKRWDAKTIEAWWWDFTARSLRGLRQMGKIV